MATLNIIDASALMSVAKAGIASVSSGTMNAYQLEDAQLEASVSALNTYFGGINGLTITDIVEYEVTGSPMAAGLPAGPQSLKTDAMAVDEWIDAQVEAGNLTVMSTKEGTLLKEGMAANPNFRKEDIGDDSIASVASAAISNGDSVNINSASNTTKITA